MKTLKLQSYSLPQAGICSKDTAKNIEPRHPDMAYFRVVNTKMKPHYLILVLLFLLPWLNTFGQSIKLENKHTTLVIDGNRIVSLYDKTRNLEHASGNKSRQSIMQVNIMDQNNLVVAIDMDEMQVRTISSNTSLTLFFEHTLVEGKAIIRLSGTPGEIEFLLDMKPLSDAYAITNLVYPSFETSNNYNEKEKYCLTPYREGRLTPISVVLSAGNETYSFMNYPKLLFSQFIACLSEKGGFMLWTNDTKGYTKEFGRDYYADASRFAIKHFMPIEKGKEQNISYTSKISFTGPDWFDAADLYRSWSEKQHWSSIKLNDRTDLPDILKTKTPIVFSGQLDKENLSTLPDTLEAWAKLLGAPVIYRPLGWEKHGNWNSIDYFPPSIGEERFKDLTGRLKAKDILVAGFISGYSWKTTNQAMMDHFNEMGGHELCETDIHGQLKRPIRICRGNEFGKVFLQNTASSMLDLGMTIIHNDVDYGTYQFHSEGCFNTNHGHPVPNGLWEMDITREAHDDILLEASGRGIKDFFLTKEGYTEMLNQSIHGSQSRFFKQMTEPFLVPLAQYIHHEYVSCIFGLTTAGSEIESTAMMLIAGQIPSLAFWNQGIKPPKMTKTPETILLIDYFKAMNAHAKTFLRFGKMQRPLIYDAPFSENKISEANVAKAEGGTAKVQFEKPFVEKKPLVLQSTWADELGNLGVFAVNTLSSAQTVSLKTPAGNWEVSIYLADEKQKTYNLKSGMEMNWTIPSGRFCSVVLRNIN